MSAPEFFWLPAFALPYLRRFDEESEKWYNKAKAKRSDLTREEDEIHDYLSNYNYQTKAVNKQLSVYNQAGDRIAWTNGSISRKPSSIICFKEADIVLPALILILASSSTSRFYNEEFQDAYLPEKVLKSYGFRTLSLSLIIYPIWYIFFLLLLFIPLLIYFQNNCLTFLPERV